MMLVVDGCRNLHDKYNTNEGNCSCQLSQAERAAIERIQQVALGNALNNHYESYDHELHVTGLPTLNDRRTNLCYKFVQKVYDSHINSIFNKT